MRYKLKQMPRVQFDLATRAHNGRNLHVEDKRQHKKKITAFISVVSACPTTGGGEHAKVPKYRLPGGMVPNLRVGIRSYNVA